MIVNNVMMLLDDDDDNDSVIMTLRDSTEKTGAAEIFIEGNGVWLNSEECRAMAAVLIKKANAYDAR